MATQLGLYNDALVEHLGQRKLASLVEESEARECLDDVYNDVLLDCLQSGFWNFAMRAVKIDAEATAPAFGYSYKFEKPSDWVRTRDISLSETFRPALTDFQDQEGFWLCNGDPLYVRFVSTDSGLTPALFPTKYASFVSASLAFSVYKKVTGHSEDEKQKFEKYVLKPALKDAMAVDAMDGPPEFPPEGAWAAARVGRYGRDRRGSSLIG